jgi:hypothetical protein
MSEDELYEEMVSELRSRLKCREELLELANIILQEEFFEEDVDWKNL